MPSTTINVRVDKELKSNCERIFGELGFGIEPFLQAGLFAFVKGGFASDDGQKAGIDNLAVLIFCGDGSAFNASERGEQNGGFFPDAGQQFLIGLESLVGGAVTHAQFLVLA